MENEKLEKDWKLFQELLPQWQERYICQINERYIQLLQKKEKPSVLFWELFKNINKDKNNSGVQIRTSKKTFVFTLSILLRDGVITNDDLQSFTIELRKKLIPELLY